MAGRAIKTNHKAVAEYYASLKDVETISTAEGATSKAFGRLLDAIATEMGWTFVPQHRLSPAVIPDATLFEYGNVVRGVWEAKDTHDDLEREIDRKRARGYPLDNTVFEDTRRAVLFQNGSRRDEYDLTSKKDLALFLTQFFGHTTQQIEEFKAAVAEFQKRIPDLAETLHDAIGKELKENPTFRAAFESLRETCRKAIDPNISEGAIQDMLVQHLVTERLFREVFDDEDFRTRNVIAAEMEKTVQALTSRHFNRNQWAQRTDPFYLAIEREAATITEHAEKQRFLNEVYEAFFRGWSPKVADILGIVYTPQPIVDFMVASVDRLLKDHFDAGLSTPGVRVLDPCTGTGNYLVNVIRRIDPPSLKHKYAEDLFANEVMLLPYYLASLNIERAYFDRTKEYKGFEGLCFADTLDLSDRGPTQSFDFFSDENTERVHRERAADITVVIGNPPYNVGQKSENDNNKNRTYVRAWKRVQETYMKESKATNKNKLQDPCWLFFRWATDRLRRVDGTLKDGIVAFVSNNSFVDEHAFDGMRASLEREFDLVVHLDLHGNVRKNPKLSGTAHNVFGIQVGVGITFLVKSAKLRAGNPNREAVVAVPSVGTLQSHGDPEKVSQSDRSDRISAPSARPRARILYHRVPEDWRKGAKLDFLTQKGDVAGVDWTELQPTAKHVWRSEGMRAEWDDFLPLGLKDEKFVGSGQKHSIFADYSLGVVTNRDGWVYDWSASTLKDKIDRTIKFYNGEIDRWRKMGVKRPTVDEFVQNDDAQIKWSRDLKKDLAKGRKIEFNPASIRNAVYRPFSRMSLYLDPVLNQDIFRQPKFFPPNAQNVALVVTGVAGRSPFSVLTCDALPDLNGISTLAPSQCFPVNVFREDGTARRTNITAWALAQFRAAYGPAVEERDVFDYVVALLHHPGYRERYRENLRRELPRVPLLAPEAMAALLDHPDSPPVGPGCPFRSSWDSKRLYNVEEDTEFDDEFTSPWNRADVDRGFLAFCALGRSLEGLQTHYERVHPHKLERIFTKEPFTWRVEAMKLSKDRTSLVVNECLTLAGIPPETFDYRLGNRSALEWIVDQYRVKTDARSGITLDPNRADDEEYIVRLVGQVIRVSLETNRLVALVRSVGLPEGSADAPSA